MFNVILSLVYFGSGAFIAYNPAVLQSISNLWSRDDAAAVGNQSEGLTSDSPDASTAASSVRAPRGLRGLFARLPALPTSCPRLPRVRMPKFLPTAPVMSPPLCRPRPSTQEHEEHKVEACDDDVLYVLKKHGIESPIRASRCCRSPTCTFTLAAHKHNTTIHDTASTTATSTARATPPASWFTSTASALRASRVAVLRRLRPSQRPITLDDSSPPPKSCCLPLSLLRLPGRPKPPSAPLPLTPDRMKRIDDLLLLFRQNPKASQDEDQEEKRVVDILVPHLPHHADEPAAVEHLDAPEAPAKTWRSMFKLNLNLNRSRLPLPQCFSFKAEHKEAPTPVQRCACCLEPQVHDHHLKECTDCGERVCVTKCMPYLPEKNLISTVCFVCLKAPIVRKWLIKTGGKTPPTFPSAWLTMFRLKGRADVLGELYESIEVGEGQTYADLHALLAKTPVSLCPEDMADTRHASTLGCVSSGAVYRSLPRSTKRLAVKAQVSEAWEGVKQRFEKKPNVRYWTPELEQAERKKGYFVRWDHPTNSRDCAGRCGAGCNRGMCARAVHCRECGAVSCVAGSCDWGLLPVEGLEGLHKVCRDCSDRIHRRQTGLWNLKFAFKPADGDEDAPVMPSRAITGYRALLGPGFEPATHPLKPVDIRTHEALSEPLPRQKPEADFEQGVVLTRAVGNLFASCHDATSSLTPLHEVLGLPLPGDADDALLADEPAVRRRLRHELWLKWGDSSLDMGVSDVPFMHQDASPMASALDSLELFLRHEQQVLEAAPFQELLPTPHKLLGLTTVCINRAAESKVWRRVMRTQHTDKRAPLQGETAEEAASNAAMYNNAHDQLSETRPRVACLHGYAKKLVPQVPPPTLEPKRASKLRQLWTRVTRKERQVPVYDF